MRSVRLVFCAMLALCFVPRAEAQSDSIATISASPQVMAVQPAPAPLGDLTGPLSLIGFAMAGAIAPKGRKLALSKSYIFEGTTYGPGPDVWVPEGFPEIDGETGDVIWPEGSTAAANAARAAGNRSFASAPSTGGVNTGEGQGGSSVTVSGRSAEELETMGKDQLVELAGELGIEVSREDGDTDKEPLKSDYVTALGAMRNAGGATPVDEK